MVDIAQELADYVFKNKYARYIPEKKRRENLSECIDRVCEMHLKKYSYLSDKDKEKIKWAFDTCKNRETFPSMRSLQFAGKAIEAHELRIYNCCTRHVDSLRAFAEIMYALLCGVGVGFGVTNKYISRMPDLVTAQDKSGIVCTYVIEDTIEGWADSIEALISCYFKNNAYSGRKIVFDYSRIRKKGSVLKTGGGKAPGYEPLKSAHIKIKELLDRIIEVNNQVRLEPIDAYDIIMHCADAVLAGGVRRSATICIFDATNKSMMKAKTGDWFIKNPQRGRSNNSALILRNSITQEDFFEIFKSIKEYGEPGFIFADSEDTLFNPCVEAGMIPLTEDEVCGVQMCNLTTINVSDVVDIKEFKLRCEAATIIGTLQAGYTDFKYLGVASKKITEQEALLGVSMTGILDSPDFVLNPDNLRLGAMHCVDVNVEWAEKIGINPAARVTLVKPEGSTTLVFKAFGSGAGAGHAKKFFRRVQANKLDNVYRFFASINDFATEESVWSTNKTDDVVTFPITAPDGAMTKQDLTALKHLEIIKNLQKNWVNPGSSTENNKKKVKHSVSCTIIVKDDEWDRVSKYLFKNRNFFAAVSFLSDTGDKDYAQAPNEAVLTDEDKAKFDSFVERFQHVDYDLLTEEEDETKLQQNVACAGGACEII